MHRSPLVAAIFLVPALLGPAPLAAAASAPDLVPIGISVQNWRAGETATFVGLVANAGTAPAPASTARFLVDGVAIGTAPTPSIAPGGSVSVPSPPWIATGGYHEVRIVVDVFDHAIESNEANNAYARTFGVSVLVFSTSANLGSSAALTQTGALDLARPYNRVEAELTCPGARAAFTLTPFESPLTSAVGTCGLPAGGNFPNLPKGSHPYALAAAGTGVVTLRVYGIPN